MGRCYKRSSLKTISDVNLDASRAELATAAFSARDVKPRQFHFLPIEILPRLPQEILVRDPSATWHNTGLAGVGETVEDIAEGIMQEVAGFALSVSSPSECRWDAMQQSCSAA